MEKCLECMLTCVGSFGLVMVFADSLSCFGVEDVIHLFGAFRVRSLQYKPPDRRLLRMS